MTRAARPPLPRSTYRHGDLRRTLLDAGIALARAGRFENETVVFLHTGGAQGLAGYQGELEAGL